MSAAFPSPVVPSILSPQAAGTHYPANIDELNELLGRSLVTSRSTSIENAKMVIAPASFGEASGAVMASAFANLANRRAMIKKVVVLGAARRNLLRGVLLPSHEAFSTPLGQVKIDAWNRRTLRALPQVSVNDLGFADEGSVEAVLPLLQVCLDQFELTPVLIGNVPAEVVAEVLRKVWGGAETLIVITSDLSNHLDAERARAFDIDTRGHIEMLSHDQMTTTRADGHRIIAGALLRAIELDLRVTGLDFRTSPGMGGKAQGHGAFAFEPAQVAHLNGAEQRHLLRLAAQTVVATAENPVSPARPLITQRAPMTLSAIRAVTVSLEQDGVLRGIAGGMRPFRTLLADVVARAGQAAAGDARFPAITLDETARKLSIRISIASTPRPIPSATEAAAVGMIMPGRDGIVLEERGRTAHALPDEWNRIPDPALLLRTLKQRAGLPAHYWSANVSIKRFTAETFSAPFSSLLD